MAIGDTVRCPDCGEEFTIEWDGSLESKPLTAWPKWKKATDDREKDAIPHGRDKQHGGERIFHL